MQAIILAAGFGSRLRPLTDFTPKALVPCAGKCMLDHAISYLTSQGVTSIIVNVHHFGEQIIKHLSSNKYNIEILVSDERKELKDTGGALVAALPLMKDTRNILIFNTDVLTNMDLSLLNVDHLHSDARATLIVQDRDSSRKLAFDKNNHLTGWYNYKTKESIGDTHMEKSDLYAFSGIHMIDLELIRKYKTIYGNKPFPMIPAYLSCAGEFQIQAYVASNEIMWLETGSPERLAEAERFMLNEEEEG